MIEPWDFPEYDPDDDAVCRDLDLLIAEVSELVEAATQRHWGIRNVPDPIRVLVRQVAQRVWYSGAPAELTPSEESLCRTYNREPSRFLGPWNMNAAGVSRVAPGGSGHLAAAPDPFRARRRA
ncbi:hypothetical protein [Tsukamurella pulmonis]|uniref:hypothetical protein n=1 Tax=Tsukamurella pulmonis TaxID=47312 RepID=UPI000A6FD383|nr:hypothetical protein [Tsukamurella pulmonis]